MSISTSSTTPSMESFDHPVPMTLPSSHPSLSLHSSMNYVDDLYHDESQVGARTSHQHPDITTPNFDVRESETAYFLEGEFPGVANKDAITLEQIGLRTLMVETKLAKVDLESEWGLCMVPRCHPAEIGMRYEKSDTDLTHWVVADQAFHCDQAVQPGGAVFYDDNQKDFKLGMVRDVVSERHVGHLRRSFTFSAPVDFDGLKAKFAHGLLKVMLMKSRRLPNEHHIFSIDDESAMKS